MKQKKIHFENKDKIIEGIQSSPDNGSNSLIILVHGFTGSKDGPGGLFIPLSEMLVSKGYSVLRFNFRFTTDDLKEFYKMTISGEVSDLKLIMDEMSKSYENISLLGESMGGSVSILSYDDRVRCMVLWYPAVFLEKTSLKARTETVEAKDELERTGFVTLAKGDGQKFKVSRTFIEERKKIDLIPYASSISCPTLILHGDVDSTVPFGQSEQLLGMLKGEKKLENIQNSDHGWWNSDRSDRMSSAQQRVINLTVDWFEKWLR